MRRHRAWVVASAEPSLNPCVFMFQDTGNEGFAEDLERWYWATCFRQTYAQGANTQVLQDVKQLRAWAADEGAVPDVVAQFSISDEQLNEGRRLNEMLVRGILGRQIALGSKDWAEGLLMRESVSLEIHHIFERRDRQLSGAGWCRRIPFSTSQRSSRPTSAFATRPWKCA